MTTVPVEAPERFPIKLPSGFDPQKHLEGLRSHINGMYPNAAYTIANIDIDSGTATAVRERAVSEVRHDSKTDAHVVNLVKGTKPSDGDAMAAKFEAQYAGYTLTDFEPFLQKARLTRLSPAERHARDALAVALGAKPWDVKIREAKYGGFDVVLPKSYVPSKHDQKLDEVVRTAIGDEGWFMQSNSKTYRARIVPGDPPTFDPIYSFDFSSLPKPGSISDKELWRIPSGVALAPRGEKNRVLVEDLSDSVGDLSVGLAGSGKAQPLSSLIPVPVQERFPNGQARIGDLMEGDLCYAADGSETRIIGFSDIRSEETHRLHLSDGQVIEAGAGHIWKASSAVSRSAHTPAMSRDREAHRVEYQRRAKELREVASSVGAGSMSSLSDIARMIGMGETSLYQFAEVLAPLATRLTLATLGGAGRSSTVTAYPVDEVIQFVADRIESQSRTDRRGREVEPLEKLVTTADMMRSLRYGKAQRANWAIRVADPIEGSDEGIIIPGYVLGAWLGDGTSRNGNITSEDDEIVENITDSGYRMTEMEDRGKASVYRADGLCADLRSLGLIGDKRIPANYLRASVATRLAVLQGLMDTDGTISKRGTCELSLNKRDLALDALELIRSLGIKASMTENESSYRTEDGSKKVTGTRHRIKFTTDRAVFRLTRKAKRLPLSTRETQNLIYVTDITIRESVPMRCLKVEHPEHLYLTGGFVPTHNSVSTQAFIFNVLARGWELALINTVDKATDFIWAKPFVKEHMWGCDSVAQAVTVAKLVIEEGERRGELLSTYGASKWQELPAHVRADNPPLLLVADELAALLTADPLPSGLSKEMKELPEFVKMQQDMLESKLLATALSKIPAVYRAAGIRVRYLTQQPNERYGFSTKLKGNLPHRIMLGVNPSQAEKGHAFRTPEKVPDVPKNIAQDSSLSRGVGLAHLDGQEPVVFKGFYAPLEDYLSEAKRRGFPTTSRPAPSAAQIERLVPQIGDGMPEEEEGFGRGPRQLEEWEIDPETGKPLSASQRANAAKHRLTVDANKG